MEAKSAFWPPRPQAASVVLASLNHLPEATGQSLDTPCLVDEVERTAFEGELLVRRLGVARQEYQRHIHAALPQSE